MLRGTTASRWPPAGSLLRKRQRHVLRGDVRIRDRKHDVLLSLVHVRHGRGVRRSRKGRSRDLLLGSPFLRESKSYPKSAGSRSGVEGMLSRGPGVEARDPFLEGGLVRRLILLFRDPSTDLGIAIRLERGMVLIHQVYIDVRGDLSSEKAHHFPCFRDSAGHYQVPHEESPLREPLLVEDEIADLALHLPESFLDGLRIVLRLGVALRSRSTPVLEVRHVDVDDAVEKPQALERVVSAGVVDEG